MRERVPVPSASASGGFTLPSRVRVGAADDAREREADRIADDALRGAPIARPAPDAPVLRREKTDADKLKDGAEKVAEAAAETPTGKRIIAAAKDLPAFKWATDTKTGIAITGGVAVGAVLALGLTGNELPVQVPAIPWRNWKFKLEWKGPVFEPTEAKLTVTYTFGGPSENDKARATPAKPAPDPLITGIQQQITDQQFPPQAGPLPPLIPRFGDFGYDYKVPGAKPTPPPPPGLQLKTPSLSEGGFKPRPMLHIDTPQLKLDDLPVLRRSATGDGPALAPPETQRVLDAPGRALDAGTRGDMERRFGVDLAAIRIHDDAEAAASARAVSARAWAYGRHLAFAAGAYQPGTPDGRRLLAHELAHTVQQGAA